MVALYLSVLIIQVLLGFFVFFLALSFLTGAPFVPSSRTAAGAMVKLAKLKPSTKVYDLGSGDGRLLILAAQKGARAVGLEINPYLVLLSRWRAFASPYRRVITIYWQNFWRANLSDAQVVFVYLLPWRMEKLANKLKKELKPGAIVVSNGFIFPGWKILRQDRQAHIYVFRVGSSEG